MLFRNFLLHTQWYNNIFMLQLIPFVTTILYCIMIEVDIPVINNCEFYYYIRIYYESSDVTDSILGSTLNQDNTNLDRFWVQKSSEIPTNESQSPTVFRFLYIEVDGRSLRENFISHYVFVRNKSHGWISCISGYKGMYTQQGDYVLSQGGRSDHNYILFLFPLENTPFF